MVLAILLVVLGSTLVGCGVLVFRRKVSDASLRKHNDIIGNYVMVITALYGIFLTFVIIDLWEQQNETERNTVSEANELHGLFRTVRAMPEPTRRELMNATREYVAVVLVKEWPAMLSGDVREPEVDYRFVDTLWNPLMSFEPRTEKDKVLFAEAIHYCEDVLMCRRIRLLDSERGLPAYIWIILVAGAAINIVFMYAVGAESIGAQAVFTGLTTALILLLLFTVADLEKPYRGFWRVTPEPYKVLKDRMEFVFNAEGG